MIVAVNDGARIVAFEIALEGPVVGKAERDQCPGGPYRVERDDISAVIWASDPHQRLTRYRVKIRELNRIAGRRPDFRV